MKSLLSCPCLVGDSTLVSICATLIGLSESYRRSMKFRGRYVGGSRGVLEGWGRVDRVKIPYISI